MNSDKSGRSVALITGASSGIGAEFARNLAVKGYDLVLVARREERLKALVEDLTQRHSGNYDVLAADLTGAEDVKRVEDYIVQMDVLDMLINNAGFGTTGHFADIDLEKQIDMIQLHVLAPVRLCHAALPGMISRGRGAIINVASTAAFWPLPENVNYSASKRYLVVFSQALQAELKGTGVRVQALCPGFTYTEFHDTSEFSGFSRGNVPGPLWMKADELVQLSLDALDRGKPVYVPGWKNRLLVSGTARKMMSWIPRGWIRKFLKRKQK